MMTRPRLPIDADFSSSLNLSIIAPPYKKSPANVLILLHGFGGTERPFADFARAMSLPETVCISIRAPKSLMVGLDGFHWSDDVLLEQANSKIDYDAGFLESTNILASNVIQSILIEKCGFKERQMFLFGFGQGGTAALAAAANLESIGKDALGGVITIGGPLPSMNQTTVQQYKCPVLALGGSSNSSIDGDCVKKLKGSFKYVEYRQWPRAGDLMPSSREEALPIMQFFGRRLQSYNGVPKDSIELR